MENFDCTRTPETVILKQYMDVLRELKITTVPCRLGSVVGFLSPIRHLALLMLSLTMTHAVQLRSWEQAAPKWTVTARFGEVNFLSFDFSLQSWCCQQIEVLIRGLSKGWASSQAPPPSHCSADIPSLWCCHLIVPCPSSRMLWDVLSDGRSQKMIKLKPIISDLS